ncbi:phosphoribosylaminoimidazolesuccinocarboxamide synthase [Alteribacillus iranensis]|uniref:Phosphoribosylaminoimidazole-succinocarboxamide synthase n=1 Tax=Alteribacillus iranensis TaxID=930128 RepID=A0A1I2EB92_9BACI|nr:phosphoribosylaminoimidazolesuccinocarboxamide synthase [Alteribacillus iranensis]SFE89866.1 phosphoribosylaminoimidazole-succinocarboxamide synthase [Alteribacillus iranensis]
MKLIYSGKTKDVYENDDHYVLKFKDDVTGENGVFDPGANSVGLTMEGAGKAGLRLTVFFFEKLKEAGIPTHYIDADIEQAEMSVRPASVFGEGLEVICRYRAVGSFLRRYGKYAKEGQPLDAFVEVTLKDDERQDPPISADALEMLGILDHEEYSRLKELTQNISGVVRDELAKKDIELYDIKLEFGRLDDGTIVLIDEISGGNMRAYQNDDYMEPLELEQMMLSSK